MSIWNALAEGQTPRIYRAGQMIYLQGAQPDYFYYLLSGTVRSFISSPNGEERVLALRRSGDIMGEASFFDECPRVSSAMAMTECKVIAVDRSRLDSTFLRHPELAFPMLQHLAKTVRLLSGHVDSAALPADGRIARYLLSLPGEEGAGLTCTHESIGQAVGVSRVTVSRTLGEFTRSGLIRSGYRAVTILDREQLEHIAYAK